MDFKTNEGVIEIFKSLNCIGNDNCFFVSFKDTNREGFKAGALGAVGGALGAAAAFATGVVEGIEGFDGLLINATEKGLGLVPLSVKGVQLMLNADKMEPQLDRFVFIANENIEDISVKNFNVFNKKTQKVHIKLKGGTTIHQLAHVSEKAIPYQETNFAKFMNKYKNGGAPQTESNSTTQQVNVAPNQFESTPTQMNNEQNMKPAEVFVARENFYANNEGNIFGAFALTEDVLTGLPLDPKNTFMCQGKRVEEWKLMLISTTKKGSVGELEYYSALNKLKEFSIGEKDGYMIIKPLTLDEQMRIMN